MRFYTNAGIDPRHRYRALAREATDEDIERWADDLVWTQQQPDLSEADLIILEQQTEAVTRERERRAHFGLDRAPLTFGFERDFLDEVRRRTVLADLIVEGGIRLSRTSRGFKGLCPFHVESNPSFYVFTNDPDDQHYHCFGCAAHGDVFTWLQHQWGASFAGAVVQLAQRAGLPHNLPNRASRPGHRPVLRVREIRRA